MHTPGICAVILTSGAEAPAGQRLNALIDAVNADTEMVLVALAPKQKPLKPLLWARAAFIVDIPEAASEADTLRLMVNEVLMRGRDAALVLWLGGDAVHSAAVKRMIASYCEADDSVWAVALEGDPPPGRCCWDATLLNCCCGIAHGSR